MLAKEKVKALYQTGFRAGAAGLALALVAPSCADSPDQSQDAVRGNPHAPVSDYPVLDGGTWVRGANLKDALGRPQARQEHAAAVLNGFVYLIGGFVPIQPPPAATEDNPEPFPFVGTGEVLVYTPLGHPADPPAVPGQWVSLPQTSSFPLPDAHHIVAVAHQGRIWAFGGHSGPFAPTAGIYVFTPESATSPAGTWQQVRASDGGACGAGEQCLELPEPRSAGAGVSVGDRVYLMGGVVPNVGSPDPVNESIRTTNSVIALPAPAGQPASEQGAGLGLVGATDSTQALLGAEGAQASLRLRNDDGRQQLVSP